MSQLTQCLFDTTEIPTVHLGGGNDYVGTTDDRGFTYIVTEPCSAETPITLVQRAKIVQLDPSGIPTGVEYKDDSTQGLSTLWCIQVIMDIDRQNWRSLVRDIGRTQCRHWGLSV